MEDTRSAKFVAKENREQRRWAILGINARTARVRFFKAKGEAVDMDIDLPKLPRGSAPSEMLYEDLLRNTLDTKAEAQRG
jgi:hypothetical protein